MTWEKQDTMSAGEVLLGEIAKACNDEVNAKEKKRVDGKKKKSTCQKLGQDKHDCCERKIQEHREKSKKAGGDPNGDPPVEGEQCYNRPESGKPVDRTAQPMNRKQAIQGAIETASKAAGGKASRAAISAEIGKTLSGKVFPDAAILSNGKRVLVDFKFACPESHRSKRKKARKNYRPPKQSNRQQRAHDALGDAESITIQL